MGSGPVGDDDYHTEESGPQREPQGMADYQFGIPQFPQGINNHKIKAQRDHTIVDMQMSLKLIC